MPLDSMLKHLPLRLPLRFILLSLLAFLLIITPVQATETIYLNFSILGRSIPVSELENFAETGELEGRLGYYLKRFTTPEQQAQIRGVLQTRYPVDPVLVDRFSYTSSGVRLFREVGEILQTEARLNGGQAIRAAAILAADEPQGISVISFLQQFPTDIRIDLRHVLRLAQRVTGIVKQTEAITKQLSQTASTPPSAPADLSLDLSQPGTVAYQKQTLELNDIKRARRFAADLYLPSVPSGVAGPTPLIVMSNGLGAGRDRFDEIALHLASHGYAIAIPDHPGSDRQRLREFYAGLHKENFDATEYLDRPQDISFLLDELERLNPSLGNILNLERVGIFGYSFGGSTALSLGGAELDFDFLESDCQTELGLVNISLLYQCRALELPRDPVLLKDDRIKAAFIFVPFGKSLFGQAGMAKVTIPVFWQVTDLDILTPLVVEQLPAFQALTANESPANSLPVNNDHYLAITAGLPHARVTYDAIGRLTNATTPWETLKQIAQGYQNALSLAFFQVYVSQSESYRPYLTATYAKVLTQPPYSLSLLQSLPLDL